MKWNGGNYFREAKKNGFTSFTLFGIFRVSELEIVLFFQVNKFDFFLSNRLHTRRFLYFLFYLPNSSETIQERTIQPRRSKTGI